MEKPKYRPKRNKAKYNKNKQTNQNKSNKPPEPLKVTIKPSFQEESQRGKTQGEESKREEHQEEEPTREVNPKKKEKYKKPKKGERLKFISKKSLERRVNQCKIFLSNLETDRDDIVELRKLINVFLIREMDKSIEEKRKKGTDNALWDKKIKVAKEEFMEYMNK